MTPEQRIGELTQRVREQDRTIERWRGLRDSDQAEVIALRAEVPGYVWKRRLKVGITVKGA